jgi:prepilin-type N-terminal cleavage/methylation domain-containing protein
MGVSVLRALRNKRFDGAGNQREAGFTLVEIVIVIVVLGLLAAVVLFALGGITSKSAQAACRADGATVSESISDFNNVAPNVFVSVATSTGGVAAENLLLGSNYGGPYLSEWPNNAPHYAFTINPAGVLEVEIGTTGSLGAPIAYGGPASCPSTIN